MSDEWQLRKDVDKLKNDVYDFKDGSLRIVPFMEDSPLLNIGTVPSNEGTLDGILDYYDLRNMDEHILAVVTGEEGIDLDGYVTDEELNSILSSYVTSSYLSTNYALKTHTHSQYIRREEISDLDIDLTTLNLVPYSDNQNGVMCFDRVQKTIEELDISLSADTMSNGYLKIEANLIERSS